MNMIVLGTESCYVKLKEHITLIKKKSYLPTLNYQSLSKLAKTTVSHT